MNDDEIQKVYDSFVLPDEDKEMIYENIIKGKRMKQPMSKWMKAAMIAGCLLVGTSSVYAAVNLLKPSEVAENFEDKKLAGKFAALSDHIVTRENDKYRVSYLGEVSGITSFPVMMWRSLLTREYIWESVIKHPVPICMPLMKKQARSVAKRIIREPICYLNWISIRQRQTPRNRKKY